MKVSPKSTIAAIVKAHPASARVFESHRIDYCCGGGQALEVACAARGLDLAAVVQDLERVLGAPAEEAPPDSLPTPALIDRIVRVHHGYLREVLPVLEARAAKVARVHGGKDARLEELDATVRDLTWLLLRHLDDEEQRLFPGILALPGQSAADDAHDGCCGGGCDAGEASGALELELAGMEREHEAVAALLERTARLTDGHTPPPWACTTYRVLLADLAEVERDIHRHVFLENQVLAPRARALLVGAGGGR